MKKILIASLFACIMLILPLNNVVGVSDVDDDCNCQPISNLHLVILEKLSNKLDRLLVRLEIYTIIISILYKHIPEVIEKFKELSNEITTFQESNNALESYFEFGIHDMICDALLEIDNLTLDYANYIWYLMEEYPALKLILHPIFVELIIVNIIVFYLYDFLLCP